MKWYIFLANQRVIFFYKWLDVVFKLFSGKGCNLMCVDPRVSFWKIWKPDLCIMTQQLKERWKAFWFDIVGIIFLSRLGLLTEFRTWQTKVGCVLMVIVSILPHTVWTNQNSDKMTIGKAHPTLGHSAKRRTEFAELTFISILMYHVTLLLSLETISELMAR